MKQQSYHSGRKKTKRKGSFSAYLLPVVLIGIALILAGCLLNWIDLGELNSGNAEKNRFLRICEVQTSNGSTLRTAAGEPADWIEIQNTGSETLALNGLSLTMDDRLNRAFVFPNVQLNSGECLLVYADGRTTASIGNELHAPFRLPASGGSRLYLMDGSVMLDMTEIPEMNVDESYCRDADGSWFISISATPGSANRKLDRREDSITISTGLIELSEVMSSNTAFFPDENGEYSDYIELHNTSSEDVNLQGYCISDDLSQPGKWEFPAVTIPSGGYLALHCSGLDRKEDSAHLHTRFKLSQDGETLCLSNPDGQIISMVSLPYLECGQAYSFAGGKWTVEIGPTPNSENSAEAAARLNELMLARSGQAVYISEIMASPVNEEYDWVEIYNAASSAVDLSGFGLSDDFARPRKWQFPEGTIIGANQRIGVYLTGNAESKRSKTLRAPFALSAQGGYSVCLAAPDGRVIDSIFVPQQYDGISYGRSDSGMCGYLEMSSPLAANSGRCYPGRAQQAQYSVNGGLYKTGDSFTVSLSAEAGARIYYTLDCSDPTEASMLYDGTPIAVSGTTILRTRVYRDGYLPSIMKTQSYLFDVNGAGEVPYVVSLVSDPAGLYSDETGIMVKGLNATKRFPYGTYGEGANFWMDWERESHIEFFTASGETAVSQECGIKIHGRNSRAYELKPFKVIARPNYGDSNFSYPIFSDREYDEYERFILRYSGQDYKYAFMRDVVLTSLAENTSVMYQEAEECILYLNGAYYSAMYIREHMSTYAIARYNGWEGQENKIDLVKGGYTVMQGSNDTYAELKEWLRTHDTSTQEAYEKIASIVDIDNFIEYIALQVVIGPPDTVNVKRYRNPNEDGKWRWILFDVDRGMREDIDGFALLAQGTNADLFMAFMNNPILRERFLNYFNEALAGYLSSASMLERADEQFERIMPILPDYLKTIGLSRKSYLSYFDIFKSWMRKRPGQAIEDCANYLQLTPEEVQRWLPDALAAAEAYAAANTD